MLACGYALMEKSYALRNQWIHSEEYSKLHPFINRQYMKGIYMCIITFIYALENKNQIMDNPIERRTMQQHNKHA